ncbi:MAG TPA: hypothetical protein VJG64_03480 [Candidatus Paceibacterota bacterium]
MRTTITILKYALATLIVLILGGLAGWYFFVYSQTTSTNATNAARGLGTEPPSFTGTLGSNVANTGESGVQNTESTARAGVGVPQRLWEVDRAPVAGMGFRVNASLLSTSTALYFAERASGYIFEADPHEGKVVRLTNTLMPKTYEAIFLPGKRGVLLRSLDKNAAITTFVGSLHATTSAGSGGANTSTTTLQVLSGYYLVKNIITIAVDQKNGGLFYLVRDPVSRGVIGATLGWNDSKPKQVFSSPIVSWQPQYGGGEITLVESAGDGLLGYAYTLRKEGVLVPLVGPAPGLTVLPHLSESALLYSASQGGVLALYAKVGKDPAALLPIKTITEKCVWNPGKSLIAYCAVPATISSQHFMDDWYQGKVHTADAWWQVDASTGSAEILYSPPQALDVQKPTIDPSGNYIAFVNGSDQSLWMLRIAE